MTNEEQNDESSLSDNSFSGNAQEKKNSQLRRLGEEMAREVKDRRLRRQNSAMDVVKENAMKKTDVNKEAVERANRRMLQRTDSSLDIAKEKAAHKTDVNKEAVKLARDRRARNQSTSLATIKDKVSELRAVNTEAVRRASDRRKRRAKTSSLISKLKDEVADKMNSREKGRKSRRRLSIELSQKFGHDSLSNIDCQKSSIAQLRPVRRKIKWNKKISDWERMQQSSTRLDALNMEDLNLHGMNVTSTGDTDSESSEGMTIEELERAIRKAFKTLKRARKEAKREKEECDQLHHHNQEMRRGLVEGVSCHVSGTSILPLTRIQSNIDELLRKNVDLDKQVEALVKEQKAIELKTEMLRGPQQENSFNSLSENNSVGERSACIYVNDEDVTNAKINPATPRKQDLQQDVSTKMDQ